jgi:type IV pilus assembly protein PilN
MMRFNFLPWREEKRSQKKALFNRLATLHFILALSVILVVWIINEKKLNTQSERNALLNSEIKILDLKIQEVSTLNEEINALQDRQAAVEKLQTNRNQPVYLLSFLAEKVPAGIMLKSLKQGDQIVLSGFALSNARVSELLRNLSQSPNQLDLGQPELIEIKATTYSTGKDSRKLFDFTVAVPNLVR